MNHIESPQTNDTAIEREIIAKGKTAPRVTPADLKANVVSLEIVKHIATSGQVLRWAVLTTKNGFAVTGRPSASVSATNDDVEIGEKVAIENATQELWPLMGYALKERLYQEAAQAPIALTPPPAPISADHLEAAALHITAANALTAQTDDFPLGKACRLAGEGTCEACQ